VFFLARNGACMTTDAATVIDDEPITQGSLLRRAVPACTCDLLRVTALS
jgi:hypothetical protein